jgi:rSAM/selenodomain-associated transferase 2
MINTVVTDFKTDTRLSVIVPVWNEAVVIGALLQSLQPLRAAGHEVIVADGGSTDGTQDLARLLCDQLVSAELRRSAQMNAGAECASGNILLFLHADTLLPEKAIDHVISTCNDPAVVGGAFDLGIDSNRFLFRITERYALLRSRMTKIPYGDQAIFLKKEIFDRMGGFNNIPIMEDIDLMRRIKHHGYKIRFIPEQVKTSPRRWEKEGIVFSTFRNVLLSTMFYMGVSPKILKKYYK